MLHYQFHAGWRFLSLTKLSLGYVTDSKLVLFKLVDSLSNTTRSKLCTASKLLDSHAVVSVSSLFRLGNSGMCFLPKKVITFLSTFTPRAVERKNEYLICGFSSKQYRYLALTLRKKTFLKTENWSKRISNLYLILFMLTEHVEKNRKH